MNVHRLLLPLAFSALSLCAFAKAKQQANLTLFVGTYTQNSWSKGIYVYNFNQETGAFKLRSTAQAGNPSFVAVSPNGKRLYAVSEFNDGKQGAYSFDYDAKTGKLTNPIFASTKAGDQQNDPKNLPMYLSSTNKVDCNKRHNKRASKGAMQRAFRTYIAAYAHPMANTFWSPT